KSTNLLHQRHLVPVVPSFNNLPIPEANDCRSRDSHRLPGCRNAQMISLMCHSRRPSRCHLVARSESVFDDHVDVREGATDALDEGHELSRSVYGDTLLCLSDADSIDSKKVVNSLKPALIPYFLKPTSH